MRHLVNDVGGTFRHRSLFPLILAAVTCATVVSPPPVAAEAFEKFEDLAHHGIEAADVTLRAWGDARASSARDPLLRERASRLDTLHADVIRERKPVTQTTPAPPGGGPDGAYGARLLTGWSTREDRPDLAAVTGSPTGAMLAMFASPDPVYMNALYELGYAHEFAGDRRWP